MQYNMTMPNEQDIAVFKETVWQFYGRQGRVLPWRTPEADGTFDPYKILVSEFMLQQTQVTRVVPKFEQWLVRFPTLAHVAQATLAEVLQAWSGLGYNRRAKFLWQAAQAIVRTHQGVVPSQLQRLTALPGIGVNTAAAILTYAYNQAVPFIETNVRTVYIHAFFADRDDVADNELMPYVVRTLEAESPREWYWALMDYGTFLKASVGNVARASRHYKKQSTFNGSVRQLRGRVIRQLASQACALSTLQQQIGDERLPKVLEALLAEQLIRYQDGKYTL